MGTLMAFNKIPGLPSWPIMLIHTIPRTPVGLSRVGLFRMSRRGPLPVGAGEEWKRGGDACVAPVLQLASKNFNIFPNNPPAKAPVGADLSRPPPLYRPAGDFPCPDSFVNDMIPLIFETSSLRPLKET